MLNIHLYINTSPNNKISKNILPQRDITGSLNDSCSILNPVLLVEYPNEDILKHNYIKIDEFGRYYFIDEIIVVTPTLYELHCRVDVLMSYKDRILAQTVIVQKAEDRSAYNTYLDDGTFRIYQNANIATQYFPYGFEEPNFILSVAGSN